MADENPKEEKKGYIVKTWLHAPKKREPTLQQENLLTALVTTKGNVPKAARLAGYKSISSAKKTLQTPHMRERLKKLMKKQGITMQRMLKTIRDGMSAEKLMLVIKDGKVVKQIRTPDWHARHKFVDTALELAELYPSEKLTVVESKEVIIEKHYD